jgi:hypothetical protein
MGETGVRGDLRRATGGDKEARRPEARGEPLPRAMTPPASAWPDGREWWSA